MDSSQLGEKVDRIRFYIWDASKLAFFPLHHVHIDICNNQFLAKFEFQAQNEIKFLAKHFAIYSAHWNTSETNLYKKTNNSFKFNV